MQAAVQVQHIRAACSFMQIIHILSHNRQRRNMFRQRRNGQMRGIRRYLQDLHAPPLIPAPDQFLVPLKSLGCSQIPGIEVLPQTCQRIPKCRYAAFGRNTSAGEYDNTLGIFQGADESGRDDEG